MEGECQPSEQVTGPTTMSDVGSMKRNAKNPIRNGVKMGFFIDSTQVMECNTTEASTACGVSKENPFW